jgi:hypothetical protein
MTFPFITLLRRVRPKPRRAKPRINRIWDRKYLVWIHCQPPLVAEHDPGCIGGCYVTAHHVKECLGSAKNDQRTVPLWRCHHLLAFGWHTVEHGRAAWEQRYGVNLEIEIYRLRSDYISQAQTADLSGQLRSDPEEKGVC